MQINYRPQQNSLSFKALTLNLDGFKPTTKTKLEGMRSALTKQAEGADIFIKRGSEAFGLPRIKISVSNKDMPNKIKTIELDQTVGPNIILNKIRGFKYELQKPYAITG